MPDPTPEQRVRGRWPGAQLETLDRSRYLGPRGGRYEFSILNSDDYRYLGFGNTPEAAWADAAGRLGP